MASKRAAQAAPSVDIGFPPKLKFLFEPWRYKVAYGGRGSGKSWGFARALIIQSMQKPLRILCAREVQKSIRESVHKLLSDQIQALGLGRYFEVLQTEIKGVNGSQFVFAGLASHTVESIKSYEGCDICWVEEAQTVSKKSWDILTPTIRRENSEIWVSFNPDLDTDETYQRFVVNKPHNAYVAQVNYNDNPWFSDVLESERKNCQLFNPQDYDNIWLGKCKTVVDGAIYADEVIQMYESGRICRVHYDPVLKVHAVFDLGWNDSMAIILCQRSASEIRIIDYIEDDHKTLDFYSQTLRGYNYNWGSLWLPHDGVVKDYKTGKSAQDILQQMGWSVEIIPIGDIEHGIKLARMIFPRLYMDKDNTSRLQECLKRYRRNIHQKTLTPTAPVHDEYSHGADCFRYLATCVDSMRNENTTASNPYRINLNIASGELAWMS